MPSEATELQTNVAAGVIRMSSQITTREYVPVEVISIT